jgi:DNA-binding NarL/FixJ family response regulator
VVGLHHERLDGSGYHRGAVAGSIGKLARVLAAADVYQAMREERAYRPARSPEQAADAIASEVTAGRLDADAVAHVLSAAGVMRKRPRAEPPAGLSERELSVLMLVARGLSNKEIGKKLFISPRTVGHHIAHIYDKTGARSRAATALFAAQHDLFRDAK